MVKFLFYIPILLAAVYFNLSFLIPRYLAKERYRSYLFGLIGTLLITSFCLVAGYYITAFFAGTTVAKLYGAEHCTYYFFGNAVPAVFAALALTTCIHLTIAWSQTRRRQQLLEKEQLETELNFLKHQLNPHFLFNTINSIFFLIHKKPDTASESLARFSDLLRYQLYECNDKQIALDKEIGFLKNSIVLERLRQNENIRVTLQNDIPDGMAPAVHAESSLSIAPFILMTFVENAFKHVSTDLPANWITIHLWLDQHLLNFSVSNSISTGAIGTVLHNSGIGLKNVQRRLDLLYPDHYQLDIRSDSASFAVHLQLDLSTQSSPSSLQNENLPILLYN